MNPNSIHLQPHNNYGSYLLMESTGVLRLGVMPDVRRGSTSLLVMLPCLTTDPISHSDPSSSTTLLRSCVLPRSWISCQKRFLYIIMLTIMPPVP